MTRGHDEGLTLVEIVIAMLLLSIVLIGLLPLLITGLRVSADNTTNATAAQLVSERMERANNRSPNCASIEGLAGSVIEVDPRGISIEVVTTVATCPAAGTPGTVLVTSTAERVDTGAELASSSTLVLVR